MQIGANRYRSVRLIKQRVLRLYVVPAHRFAVMNCHFLRFIFKYFVATGMQESDLLVGVQFGILGVERDDLGSIGLVVSDLFFVSL